MTDTASVKTPRIETPTITVGELMNRIKELILEEPKRMDIAWWISALDGHLQKVGSNDVSERLPACGTVACLAGWGAVLLRPDDANHKWLSYKAETVMTELVGYDSVFHYRGNEGIFMALPIYHEENLGYPGTEEHAQKIAARIDRYLQRHPEVVDRMIDVEDARRKFTPPEGWTGVY